MKERTKKDYDDYDLYLDELEEEEDEDEEEEETPNRRLKLKEPWNTLLSAVACVILLYTCMTEIVPNVFTINGASISRTIYMIYFWILCANGLLWGFVAYFIAKSKGYENGFFWGFFLGLIGLIVVCARPAIKPKDDALKDSQIKNNNIEAFQRLANLREKGIITEAEFQAKKKQLLDRI